MNFIPKYKKKLNFILYSISVLIFLFVSYLSAPKLQNFSLEIIKENLKKNNNININNIPKVNYKIFPTPRLSIPNSNFTIEDGIAEINNSEIEIILDIGKILDSKEIHYKKLLINKGSTKINFNNINQLLSSLDKIKKELIFKKNILIFLKKDKFFFEISDALIKVHQFKGKNELNIKGKFLNNKIFIKLDSSQKNKNNLTVKIPGLDIASKVFFEKNNLGNVSGFFNLEIYKNFFKFNFIKKNNIELINGFIRSKIINSSLEGKIIFKPNFFTRLDFQPSNLNMEKLFSLIKKNYFSDNVSNLYLIKKINGIFTFKSKFEGKITNTNGEVSFENFKVGKNQPFFFNAKVSGFGKKGKVQFNLVKIIKYKRDLSKKVEIIGFLIPSNSKVIFQKFILDGNKLSTKETKVYQSKFEDEVVQDSLANIFNENRINRFLENLF